MFQSREQFTVKRLNRLRDETGQVIAFVLICMVVLIGIVGFAVDVGHAYLVQRQLQSGVDAGALAGAQELPVVATVTTVAKQYGPDSINAPTANDNVNTNVEVCFKKTASQCSFKFDTLNAVQVSATSNVKTFFARVIGIDSLDVNATATACSPCSPKPLDIMVVLDRTGSMCDGPANPPNDPNGPCRDEGFAIDGVKTFLGYMDPALDEVGLSVFPPALDASSLCTQPSSGAKFYGYGAWWAADNSSGPNNEDSAVYTLASPDFNYLTQSPTGGWQLNTSSNLVSKLNNCIKPSGYTSYTNALAEAQYQLTRQGRGNVQDVIIFLSDGGANVTPKEVPAVVNSVADQARPCGSGIKVANQIKGQGTIIYTIGYDVDSDNQGCRGGTINGKSYVNEGGVAFANYALQQMASQPKPGVYNYYVKPDPGQLETIFTQIAADIQRPASRLIPNSLG